MPYATGDPDGVTGAVSGGAFCGQETGDALPGLEGPGPVGAGRGSREYLMGVDPDPAGPGLGLAAQGDHERRNGEQGQLPA